MGRNRAKRLLGMVWAMVLLGFSCPPQALESGLPVHISVAWLADADKQWSIAEVAGKPAQDFAPIPAQGISLGFRDDRIWLRVDLEHADSATVQGWLDLGTPRLASAVLYQPGKTQGLWAISQTGLAVPVDKRALACRGVVFPIQLQAREKRTVYFAIESNAVITLQPAWWEAQAYRHRQAQDERRDLLLLGATLGLAAFGLLQSLASRDMVLALNALRALFVAVWGSVTMGYAAFYLWPQSPSLLLPLINVLSAQILTIQMLLVALFLPHSYYPKNLRYLFFSVAAVAAGIGLSAVWITAVAPLFKALSLLGGLMQLAVFYACFISAWRGFYPAWWLLCGFSFAIFGFYRRLIEAVGWIAPSSQVDFMTLLNAFISTVFFYLGTAARVDRLRNEREQALEANVILQRETESRLDSEVKQRTLELEVARDEANRANQAKTLFLAKVSHELRSPMHTILSYADLARREKTLRYMDTISDAGQHLLDLIDDLLAYVKNSYAELHINLQPNYTHRLLEQLRAFGTTLAARGNNEFLLFADAHLPVCIETDSRRFIQMGVVLLSNAAAYTQNGQIALRLTQDGPAHLQLQVQDNGIGIAQEHLGRIFQPFERIASGGNDAGLGLGLGIALQLAKAMGGELFAASELGLGSTFTLRLPLVPADPAAIAPFNGQHDVVGYKGASRRIIVVDDTPDHRQFMIESLEAIGFEAVAADTATALLDYARLSARCDLVLLDFHLADTTADQLLPQLRQLAGWDSVPVILISASPPEQTEGFAATVSKPATQSKILATIAHVLDMEWLYAPIEDPTEPMPVSYTAADWGHALDTGDVFALEACLNDLANHEPLLARQVRQHLEHYDFLAIRQQLAVYLNRPLS
ncbi:MAG: 7TM-DISM domain-containing protein [Methylovulum sp.]|nr:7TM-DISM domain-containing protein [Methylovulum sp.]